MNSVLSKEHSNVAARVSPLLYLQATQKKKKVGRSHFFELGKFGARVMAWFTLKQLRFRAFLSPLRILLPLLSQG
jgi:hypothetical protein